MGWKEIKERMRRTVHDTFAMPAVYRSKDGRTVTNCAVRLHREQKTFGDLDREGFARMIATDNQVVIDRLELRVQMGGTIDFGDGLVVEVANVLERDGDFQPIEVTLK